MTSSIRFHAARLAYDGRAPVLDEIALHLGPGWTGIVGPNGAGKTTLLRAAIGALTPSSGTITHDPPDATVRLCEQRVDAPGDDVLALAEATDRAAMRWLRRLGLDPCQVRRWQTLSAGERKRWQLGGALAFDPEILALDEPTNHLDGATRTVLIEALSRFRGIGLVVSHDRELLDTLTTTTIRVDHGRATSYAASYTGARAQWEAEAEQRVRDRATAAADRRRTAGRLADAHRTEASASRAVSASTRIKGPRDADGRSMGAKNLAAWAAAGAGRAVARRRRELDEAEARVAALTIDKERGREIELAWEPPPRRWLASLEGVDVRAGSRLIARDVRLAVARESRIHVAGDNGAGKSTLLAALLASASLPDDRVLYLPQELSADDGRALAAEVAALPPSTRGRVGQLAAALGLDPSRALASGTPSPGEVRKLSIALGLARSIWLAVLDEPTNHLDLPSVERLQAALAAYPGALVIVTHDPQFAAALTTETWTVRDGAITART